MKRRIALTHKALARLYSSLCRRRTAAQELGLPAGLQRLNELYSSHATFLASMPWQTACAGAGCSDCCRQVPIRVSFLEAANICRFLSLLSETGILKTIRANFKHCDLAFERIKTELKKLPNGLGDSQFIEKEDSLIAATIRACPFLVNHQCAIYEARPLVCRQYVVSSKSSDCLGSKDVTLVSQKKYLSYLAHIYQERADLDVLTGLVEDDRIVLQFITRGLDFDPELKPLLFLSQRVWKCMNGEFVVVNLVAH